MNSEIIKNIEYLDLLQDIKNKVRNSRIKAAVRVNSELILLYWELGGIIIKKQKETNWGDKLIEHLSSDLSAEFPEMKGFSRANLYYIQKWVLFFKSNTEIVQQVVRQLRQSNPNKFDDLINIETVGQNEVELEQLLCLIPWGHHIQILTHCKNIDSAIFYILKTIENNWSRSVLIHQMELNLFERQGKAITNFEQTLPKLQSELAFETLKDPYIFDFLTLKEKADERDIENQLVNHITKFLLELGKGFAYIGKQYHLEVSGKDYYLDLLFYHIKLHCFIVIELKAVEFQPEQAGKLNFYLSAVDDILKREQDNPSIGLILCKTKDKISAEYALRGMTQPIGIAEYQLSKAVPKELKSSLPSIEEIEKELQ